MSKTLDELVLLENIVHSTGLRGDAAEAEFQKRKVSATKPFYLHNPQRQLRFYQWLYEETNGSRLIRNQRPLPPFNEWLTADEKAFIGL